MTVIIRKAAEHDIDEMYAISCAVHLTPLYKHLIPASEYPRFFEKYTPSPERLAFYYERKIAMLHDPSWQLWVAEADGTVVGFTIAHDEDGYFLLKGLFVDERYQGQGIGRRLFDVSLGIADEDQVIALEVIEGNEKAIAMYERSGFYRTDHAPKLFYGATMLRLQKH